MRKKRVRGFHLRNISPTGPEITKYSQRHATIRFASMMKNNLTRKAAGMRVVPQSFLIGFTSLIDNTEGSAFQLSQFTLYIQEMTEG